MAQLNNLIVTGAGRFLNGLNSSGQILTSFKNSVAPGTYQPTAESVPALCEELRYSSGAMGSVEIKSAYTLNGITIATGWYTFIWVPHRFGGMNGETYGDNCNYGTFYLTSMTTTSARFVVRYAGGSIIEVIDLTAGDHNHGMLHSDFTSYVNSTSGGWSLISSSYQNGYLLKSIRFDTSPNWAVGNYGAGICFGGGDTKGVMSIDYLNPIVKFAGGNAQAPIWWIGLTGTNGTSYDLNKATITTTNPTSATTYYVPFAAGDGNQALLSNNGLRYSTQEGTSGAAGWGELVLGNGTSTGTAGNKRGWLKLFSEKSGQAELTYTASATANTTHYLPTTGGTLLNTGTTSFTQTLTSGTKIGSIKINGTSTDIFAPSVMSSMNIKIAAGSELFNGTASNPGVTITTQNAYGFVYKAVITDTQPTNLTIFKLVNGTLTYQHSATASQRTTITYASGVLTLKCTSANSNAMVWYV